MLTLGLIIPLTAGDFDVSVAAVLTFSAMILAVLNAKMGLPLWQAVLACLAMGLIVGLINAFFIIYFRIHSLIVTLGTASVIQGLILWISSSQTLSGVSPGLIDWVIVNRLFDIPLAFYYAMALGVIIWYVFEFTPIGRAPPVRWPRTRSRPPVRYQRGARPRRGPRGFQHYRHARRHH